MVVSTEMLWELLSRLGSAKDEHPSFRSMMTASHFRMAGHFLTSDNCRRFFRPLIANVKKEFEDARILFEDALNTQLGDHYLDEFEEVKWPSIVSELQSEAIRRSTQRSREQQHLAEENERLRSMVSKFEESERKRREYTARQRAEQRERNQRRQPR